MKKKETLLLLTTRKGQPLGSSGLGVCAVLLMTLAAAVHCSNFTSAKRRRNK